MMSSVIAKRTRTALESSANATQSGALDPAAKRSRRTTTTGCPSSSTPPRQARERSTIPPPAPSREHTSARRLLCPELGQLHFEEVPIAVPSSSGAASFQDVVVAKPLTPPTGVTPPAAVMQHVVEVEDDEDAQLKTDVLRFVTQTSLQTMRDVQGLAARVDAMQNQVATKAELAATMDAARSSWTTATTTLKPSTIEEKPTTKQEYNNTLLAANLVLACSEAMRCRESLDRALALNSSTQALMAEREKQIEMVQGVTRTLTERLLGAREAYVELQGKHATQMLHAAACAVEIRDAADTWEADRKILQDKLAATESRANRLGLAASACSFRVLSILGSKQFGSQGKEDLVYEAIKQMELSQQQIWRTA